MRRDFARYDRLFDTSTTAEDDSCFSSEIDLLNPRVTQSYQRLRSVRRSLENEEADQLNLLELPSKSLYCRHPIVNGRNIQVKLLAREGTKDTPQHTSNVRSSASYNSLKKYEPQVTFEGDHSSESERFYRKINLERPRRKENSTPRIVRAIRQNSRKLEPKENKSATSDRPQARYSKSSVVVLYHGRPNSPSSSSKVFVQTSKSDQTVIEKSNVSQPESASLSLPDKTKIEKDVETSESLSPVCPRYRLRRRRTVSRQYRRVSRQQPSLNVNIYHANRVERIVPLQRYWDALEEVKIDSKCKGSEGARPSKDPLKSQEKTIAYHDKNAINQRSQKCMRRERIWKERCSPTEAIVSKPMDHRLKQEEDQVKDNHKYLAPCSNLDFVGSQQIQTHSEEASVNPAFISVNEGDEANRVFPFQPTPSGNLKIIPNQVVFESKKFSVLVADPRNTKINVKTELGRSNVDVGASTSNRTRYIDLPPGVTPSTIDQLQTQKKLPHIKANYRSQIQSNTRLNLLEMEQKQTVESTSHEVPSLTEIPLASLGFTNEQPINWSNIILPVKTDLYQELARRIINYKNADCVVRIDNDEFYCHLLVLQSYSTFFDEKNYKDINLSGSNVTSKAFSIIYDWMISPINESCQLLRRDNILEIFMAAQYLGIKELEEQCWAFIDNDELFSEDTAFLLYLEAKKIGNTAVMELMVPRIMKFFLMLVSTKDFLELSVDELCLLLKSNYICVNSEMEVLMSAVRWLMHDWDGRKQFMLEVLKCVRFGLIAPWQLVDVKRNPENPEFMELMSYPEVQKMVDDGLAFVIIKYWYGNQTEDYYHWIDLLGLSEPTNRNWAGEDKNYVTYREFLLYLEEYQKANISDLKSKKMRTKPTPPDSPPKDYSPSSPKRTHADCNQNCCCLNSHSLEQHNATQNRGSRKYVAKVASSGMVIPPEILAEYLSNMNRSNNSRASKSQCDGNRNNKSIAHNTKYRGGGESPRKPVEFLKSAKNTYEYQREGADKSKYDRQNATFSRQKQQKTTKTSRYFEDRADSSKSEEEAATMIQATYRGYKVRRKFGEIKKSSSEEKQNTQKVAELLSATQDWTYHKSLNPVKACNSVVNQSKNTLHNM